VCVCMCVREHGLKTAPPLVVFPEGTINYAPIGQLLPFKTGCFRAGEQTLTQNPKPETRNPKP
jgi:hypothetical protein